MKSFLYVNSSVKLDETIGKNALISACVLELNKVSEQNTEYRISEGNRMANQLIGKSVFYDIDYEGKHAKGEPVGVVESARKVGNRIMAKIRIHNIDLIERLRQGVKFLFSVGGIADFYEVVKKAGRTVKRMVNCVMSHLQILDPKTRVGFKNARLERVLEINESVLLVDESGLTADELTLLHLNLSMF